LVSGYVDGANLKSRLRDKMAGTAQTGAASSSAKTPAAPRSAHVARKYQSRQNAIVEAASAVLNRKGLKGMTLADVGEPLGLVGTGVAYYFASKEALTAACYMRSLGVFEQLIAGAAAAGPSPEERLGGFVRGYFTMRKRIALGEMAPIAQFDDVRTLADQAVIDAYVVMFRNLRRLFGALEDRGVARFAITERAHHLLHQFLWVEAWLPKYDAQDFDRLAEKVLDVFLHGLASGEAHWPPSRLAAPHFHAAGKDEAYQTFLRAATQMLNDHGYLGASVERIAAKLEMTKGAFYHHIDAKDDLVTICFARSSDIVRGTQRASLQMPASGCDRLASALMSLVQHHLDGEAPLLRAATVSLPETIRRQVMLAYDRNAVLFGSMLSDAMADGSARQIDVQIGAHLLNGAVNGIAELPYWLPNPPVGDAAEQFVRPLFDGLLSTWKDRS